MLTFNMLLDLEGSPTIYVHSPCNEDHKAETQNCAGNNQQASLDSWTAVVVVVAVVVAAAVVVVQVCPCDIVSFPSRLHVRRATSTRDP